jgi:hypothetical protein
VNHPFFTDDEATNFALDWLRSQGFIVTQPQSWGVRMTPKELREKSGLKSSAFCKRIYHPRCPVFKAEYGPKMRMLSIWVTDELLAWMCRPVSDFQLHGGGRRRKVSA